MYLVNEFYGSEPGKLRTEQNSLATCYKFPLCITL